MKKRKVGYLVSSLAAAALIMGVSQGAWGASLVPSTKTVAIETLSSDNATWDNASVMYVPSSYIAQGTSFKLELNNASFDNTTDGNVLVFTPNLDNTTDNSTNTLPVVCTIDATSSNKVANCSTQLTLSPNEAYYIVDNNTTNFGIDIEPTVNVGDSVSLQVASDLAGAAAQPVDLFKIEQQYKASIIPAESKISFAYAQKEFTGGTTTSTAKICLGDNPTLSIGVIDSLTKDELTQQLNGVEFKFNLTGNFDGVAEVNNLAVSSYEKSEGEVTGYITNPNAFNSTTATCKLDNTSYYTSLPITVDGKTVLTPREFKLTLQLQNNDTNMKRVETLLSDVVSHIWTLNATTYYVPLIKTDPANGVETYIKLQAKEGAGEGAYGVEVDILGSDGKTVTYDAGTITPGKPLVITGADLAQAAKDAGDEVNGTMGFAAIIKVNAPQSDLFTYANIMDPTGAKRVPVEVVTNAGDILE